MYKNNLITTIPLSQLPEGSTIQASRKFDLDVKKLKKRSSFHSMIIGWSVVMLIVASVSLSNSQPLTVATAGNGDDDNVVPNASKQITDVDITSGVQKELAFDKDVFLDNVDITTKEGIVTLTGSVSSLLAKKRVVKMTESIRGVLGAIDLLTVTPAPRPDENIRKDILSALLQDPATESYPVSVSVQDAVAKLTGTVGSHAEQQLAGRIAEGVRGVKEIQNNIAINYQTKRTEHEISADVQERMQWDVWINGGLINTSVKDGIVTLTGTVGSAVGRSRAFDDAWVNGVFAVHDDGLKIEPWARDVARQKLTYAIKPDSETTKAIQVALSLDPRVSAFAIEATDDGGSVSLNGIVGNLKAKASAEDDAKNIVSVWRVENYIKVRPKERPTDADMKSQLTGALLWDAALDGTTINASVDNRVAELSGSVDSRFQKDEAQDVASRIKGVLSVRNHLKIDPEIPLSYHTWPYDFTYDWDYPGETPSYSSQLDELRPNVSDEQIKKNIENAFFWSPYVRRSDVTVTVNAGVATLTGSVGNWIGWGEANNDAHKGGATQILNHVVVKTGGWWWF